MQQAENSGKARVLFVDDERRVLNSMRGMFRRDFDLYLTTEGSAAVRIAAETPIDVIVADQRMPGMTGIEVLGKVKELSPNTIRILLTGYADPSAVEGSINIGEVFRFLGKPCPPKLLRETLDMAVSATRASARAAERTAIPAASTQRPIAPVDMPRIKVPARGKVTLKPANPTASTAQPHRSESLLTRLTSIGQDVLFRDGRRRTKDARGTAGVSSRDVGVVLYTVDAAFAEIALRTLAKDRSPILATSLIKVMDALDKKRCGVLVTDISANGARLQKIISALKQLRPELVTIVVSDTRDTTDMVNLINRGQIFRYLQKPVSADQIRSEIEAAVVRNIELQSNPSAIRRHAVSVPANAPNPTAVLEQAVQQR